MRRDKVLFISIGVAVGILVAVASLFVFQAQLGNLQPTAKPFNSTIWKSYRHSERNKMWFDLVSRHHLFGMSRKDLIGLLGQPDRETSGELFWEMGSESKLGPISTAQNNAFRVTLREERVEGWGLSLGSATEFKTSTGENR